MVEFHATRNTIEEQARHHAHLLDAHKVYVVIAKLLSKPRTTGWKSQNHHINGHCQQIAMGTGCSFSAVKERMKELAIDRGYPIETLPDGAVKARSEADVDTVAAAALIDTIHQFADEWLEGFVFIEEEA